jgi:monofunctional biosynthetic peptidoglycan transglycosylase
VKDLKDGGQVDEAKHVGDAATAGPEAPGDAKAEAPAQSAGERASTPPAPSPEAAVPAQPSAADRLTAAAPAEAPAAPEIEPAGELSAVSPAGAADVPAGKAEGDDQAAETTVAGGSLPPPTTEPEAAADPEAAEPQTAVVEAAAPADPEPRLAEPVIAAGPEPQATAEPTEPQVPEEVVATEPQPEAAETVAAVAEPELQPAEAVAAAEPQPQEAVPAAAGPEPQPAEAPAPAEPEPRAPVEPAEPELRVPDAGGPLAEAEASAGAQVARADVYSPPVERTDVEAAPWPPAPEAAPSWDQRTEPPAPAVVLPQGQAARPAAARLPAPPPSREPAGEYRPYLRLAVRGAAAVAAGLAVIVLTLVVLYRWVNPPTSTLMIGQRLAGTPIERRWVPLERISPHLVKAVILSEDGGFCRHRGVDWTAIEEAMEEARGGSTITMQVVKNLFLWPSRSYVRKAIEIGLAYLVELIWPKWRILEIYLNIAEWGDGVFGAEAAARHHFGKAAAQLTAAEAALLAVALPSPTERTAGSPSPSMSRLAKRLIVRMAASQTSVACVRAAPRLARQVR